LAAATFGEEPPWFDSRSCGWEFKICCWI